MPRQQREAQEIRMQQVEIALQPLRAANEVSTEALTTLADDEVSLVYSARACRFLTAKYYSSFLRVDRYSSW